MPRADVAALAAAAPALDACVRCGLCATTCHVFLATGDPRDAPAAKLARLARVARDARRAGAHGGPPPDAALDDLAGAVFGRCTGCGRCTLHCTTGVDVASALAAGRRFLQERGRVPDGIARTLRNQLDTGNQMAIPRAELLATCGWLSDELVTETGDERARIPIDVAGARVLYLVNPREVQYFPLSLQAAAGLFHAAGESWTLSSRAYDVTNYALFAADPANAAELTRRVVDEAARLGVQEIVLSECGHGFRAFRWEGANWLGRPLPLPLRSMLEVIEAAMDAGRLAFDPSRNEGRVTLHDPCNLVRSGGVSEPQRRILRRAAADFVEMTPCREQNYCCGGGGGLLSLPEHGALRVAAGRIKAEQIRATGAAVVATPCHNCADQLLELARVYELPVEIRSVTEIAYDALVR